MKRKILACLVVVIMALAMSVNVFATSGSSSMSLSSSSLNVGDTLTVTISVSSDGTLFGLDGGITYNSSVLQFLSGNSANGSGGYVTIAEVADSEDQTSMSFTCTFKAISEGDSGISFSAATYDHEMTEFSTSGCGANVTVASANTNTNSSEPEYEYEPETEEEPEEEKPEEEIFATIDGVQYKIWQDYEGVELPDGFGPYIFEYENKQSMGAVDGSGRVRIAYLENTKTGDKGFYIFFNDQFIPFIHVNAVAASYTLYPLEEGVKVPVIFDQQVDNFRSGTLPVWKSSDSRLEGTILMYATAPNGDRGFYLYDEATATVQRFIQINYEDPVEVEEPTEPEEIVADKAQSLYAKIIEDKQIFTIVAVLAALSVSLLIACIFLFSVRRSKRANKEKFEKKMDRKHARFEKKQNRKNKDNPSQTAEFTIETENFDEMVEEEKTEV